jgi:O-antigen/teichoic acid export membrane protein
MRINPRYIAIKDVLSRVLNGVVGPIYERIFQEKMGKGSRKFLENLSYVSFGRSIAVLFAFAFNILSARFLGPVGYGEFTLIQSVAMFLYIPMMSGYSTAMIKYSAENQDFSRQRAIISTSYVSVALFMIASVIVYWAFLPKISGIFSVTEEITYLSIAYAVLYVFYSITTNTLRGIHKIKGYAVFQPIYDILLLLAFLGFYFFGVVSVKSMVFSNYIAYVVAGIAVMIYIRKYFIFKFDKTWAHKLFSYSNYAVISGLSVVLYSNADKILINRYLEVIDVGIYRAYSFAFLNIITIAINVLLVVLFPIACRNTNKRALFDKTDKVIKYVALLAFVVSVGSGFVTLKMYGSEYPFDLKLALLFGAASVCVSLNQIYVWLLNAVGREGAKITSSAAIIMALSNIILNVWLIPRVGLDGGVVAIIASYAIAILIIQHKRKKMFGKVND